MIPTSSPRGAFGDLLIIGGAVVDAPEYTRIALADLARPEFTVGACIAVTSVVWYKPIDLTPDGMTLICHRIRDMRPYNVPPEPRGEPTGVDTT